MVGIALVLILKNCYVNSWYNDAKGFAYCECSTKVCDSFVYTFFYINMLAYWT
jgi:hypothetical protein